MDRLNLDQEPPTRLQVARALLAPKTKPDPAWPALAAAALFAVAGLAFAWASISAQPAEFKDSRGFAPVPEEATTR